MTHAGDNDPIRDDDLEDIPEVVRMAREELGDIHDIYGKAALWTLTTLAMQMHRRLVGEENRKTWDGFKRL